ncbi:RNA-directed DNA polymerase, eukaryota [Tanacetum coccineum]
MNNTCDVSKDKGIKDTSNSYAHVVKGRPPVNGEVDSNPALVLDESCLNLQDYSRCLMGKVKDFGSLSNLKVVLGSEGFDNIDIRYLGGYWVVIDFLSEEVELEGIPLKLWSENTFKCIASKWGVLLHVDDLEEGCFYRKRVCITTTGTSNIFESFKLIYQGKAYWVRAKEVPGWVPDFVEQNDEENESDDENFEGELNEDILRNDEDLEGDNEMNAVPDTLFEDELSKSNGGEAFVGQNEMQSEDPFNIYTLLNKKKEDNKKGSSTNDSLKYPPGFTPREDIETDVEKSNQRNGSVREIGEEVKVSDDMKSGGSILLLMDELVKVGQSMGYNMDGCMKTIEEIIESQGVNEVNFLSLQETKMETIDLFDIKRCWGNFVFDYVHSDSVGNWITTGKLLLIISVYAPQELTVKKLLWDYMFHVIANWKGEVIIMGDFNEVRNKNERFGSVFNVQGVNAFSSFISSAGLEEVPLGVITLDRYLSDHRPILLRESKNLVEAPVDPSNAMLNLMKMLKYLKKKIRAWNNDMRKNSKNSKLMFKAKLSELDSVIEIGNGNGDIINKRMAVVKSIQELDKLQSLKAAQKTKIKWAIEGDENSKYYHGILNKKRNQLSIRGVLADGIWIDNPASIPDAKMVKDFRLISLIWSLYKIIAKILANRLGVVLGDIVNEVQSAFVADRQVLDGMFKGIVLDPLMQLSHMFYADDAVFVGQWSDSNIDTIVHVLDCFYRASGLRINMSKSKLMGISVDEEKVDQAAEKIRCAILKAPFSYLGSKVGGLMSRIQSWNEIVDTMVARLSKWKMKTLSIVPMKVLQRMKSIRCHFFNGADLGGKKSIWVKWNNVLASKEKGGLGVSSLYALNNVWSNLNWKI